MAITRFRGEHYFLSNMFEFDEPITTPDGVEVRTVEHLYQAAKLVDYTARLAVEGAQNGFAARQTFHTLAESGADTRPDWDLVKVGVMRVCVLAKFLGNPELAERLLATGDEELIEGNTWGDRFWGVSPPPPVGEGENMLGVILMETRDLLRRLPTEQMPDAAVLMQQVFQPPMAQSS